MARPDFLKVPDYAARNTQLAVLCCLFQGQQNPLIMANYWRFAAEIRTLGLPLYTIECVNPGESFLVPRDGTVMRCVAQTLGWHKERLLNMLARRVPPRFTKLAWLDADVIIRTRSWAYETEQLLDSHHVVQPFSAARWLDRFGRTVPEVPGPDARCCDGSVAHIAKHGASLSVFDDTHPGFAWAMRRDTWLRLGGLCDRVLTMGADAVMLGAFLGLYGQQQIHQHYTRVPTVFEWYAKAHEIVGGNVTCVYGMVDHLWHGFWMNRQYLSLGAQIFALDCDFDSSVVEDPDAPGELPRITKDPKLLDIYTRYFERRNQLEVADPTRIIDHSPA